MSDAKTKTKRKKDSFAVRIKKRGREFKSLGQILVNEPKRFPHALLHFFRRSIRTLWDARGGGFYACGYVVTFIWLEIFMFIDDVFATESVGAFFGEQIFEMLFRFFGESFRNMIIAFVWPVFIIRFSPEWGVVILAVAYVVFAKLIKAPLAAWLFHDDESAGETRSASSEVPNDY
jgi:hypothetical protein